MTRERLKSPRGRLFVALDLPDVLRAEVTEWQRRELTDPGLRALPAASLHITLVFLGWQAEKDFGRIAEAALGTSGGVPVDPVPAAPEAELSPEPVGRPTGRRPRLFAIEVRSEGVLALQAQVESRLVAARLHRPERRVYWPHLTVARVRPENRGGRKPMPVERPPSPLGRTPVRFRPTRLVVFRSHLHPSGARYEPMAELELPTAETTER